MGHTLFALLIQRLIFFYFVGINLGYFSLNLISLFAIMRYTRERVLNKLPMVYSGFELPISLLVPAYNEEANVSESLRSLLQLSYSEYEVVVINDGSKDKTLEVLKADFGLILYAESIPGQLETKAVRGVYHSPEYPNLRVIDKINGGKADALNVGINYARYPLFCSIDADSMLQRDSLQLLVQPFLEDPKTVAAGGTVRVANGCQVQGGFLIKSGLPTNLLALFQIVEYLRAFLFGRMGWSPMNAVLIISGAFGLFRKDTVIAAGGYRHGTIGEDMELVVRLHRTLREAGTPYRITYVPDPICWTEAPEDWKTLKNQRVRWHQGLSQSLTLNWSLLFHRRGGAAGWVAFPFMIVFEWLNPVVEVFGTLFMLWAGICGYISLPALGLFLFAAIGVGVVLSLNALLLEEMTFHAYPKMRQILLLFLIVLAENFGYRQINAYWRLIGLWRFAARREAKWGEMKRTASWHTPVKVEERG